MNSTPVVPNGLQNPADMPTGMVNVVPRCGPINRPGRSPRSSITHTTQPTMTGTSSSGTSSLATATSTSGVVALIDSVIGLRMAPVVNMMVNVMVNMMVNVIGSLHRDAFYTTSSHRACSIMVGAVGRDHCLGVKPLGGRGAVRAPVSVVLHALCTHAILPLKHGCFPWLEFDVFQGKDHVIRRGIPPHLGQQLRRVCLDGRVQ